MSEKSLCTSYLTTGDSKDKLGNAWLISPKEISADKFLSLLDRKNLTYLKNLDPVAWAKSTYCGTFRVGDGEDINSPEGTLCSTLGQYFNNTCFDKVSDNVDAVAKQYPIMFNARHAAKDGQTCIYPAEKADGSNWMSSPCWDLRTVGSGLIEQDTLIKDNNLTYQGV